jgi:hypothetical protein
LAVYAEYLFRLRREQPEDGHKTNGGRQPPGAADHYFDVFQDASFETDFALFLGQQQG